MSEADADVDAALSEFIAGFCDDEPTREQFLTIGEVAALLGVCTRTVSRRIKAGDIGKAATGGRTVRIPASEIARIASGRPREDSDTKSRGSATGVEAYHE